MSYSKSNFNTVQAVSKTTKHVPKHKVAFGKTVLLEDNYVSEVIGPKPSAKPPGTAKKTEVPKLSHINPQLSHNRSLTPDKSRDNSRQYA